MELAQLMLRSFTDEEIVGELVRRDYERGSDVGLGKGLERDMLVGPAARADAAGGAAAGADAQERPHDAAAASQEGSRAAPPSRIARPPSLQLDVPTHAAGTPRAPCRQEERRARQGTPIMTDESKPVTAQLRCTRCGNVPACGLIRGEPDGKQFVVCAACAYAEIAEPEPVQEPEAS